MQNSRSELVPGAVVESRGQAWRLVDRQPFERCALVTLRGLDRANAGETLRVLTPFDRLVIRGDNRPLRAAGRLEVARCVADAVLDAHPWASCWTGATANIDLLPWQIEPVLAVLGGATRVLLADAVGLGKTVQAALILAELSARALVDRTLILTPAGLRSQWAEELAARFDLHASVLDQAALAREAASLPPDVTPWATSAIVISSIDLVKRTETLIALEQVPFDLLIVDEAHHLTPGSDRGIVVAKLAQRTPWVVLISATPHSGDERAFAFLRDVGSTSADRLHIFRRAAPLSDRRPRSRLVAVNTSEEERALLDGVQRYASAIWSAQSGADSAARLVAIVLARRAASTADAVLASLIRRRALLGGAPIVTVEQQSLPWEEIDEGDGDAVDAVLATPGLANEDDERTELDRLIALAHHARAGATKLRWIERFIARAREPVIVFSEYRDSVEALRARVASSSQTTMIHGGLSPAERRAAVSAFVTGTTTLLLATDAAGEGLNLQARCRTVINLELPWNPLRLDQRIGRVDRIGQQRRVHAAQLLHTGSIEAQVLGHLYRRVARATDVLSPSGQTAADVESRVAEAVFTGAHPPSLSLSQLPHQPTPAAVDEVHRLEELRRLLHGGRRASGGASVPVCQPRRSGGAITRLLAVFRVALVDRSGRPVITTIVPIIIAPQNALPRDLHGVLVTLTEPSSLQTLVLRSAEDRVRSSLVLMRDLAQSVDRRIGELASRLQREGEQPYQPALFDSRSAYAAAARAAVRAAHGERLRCLGEIVCGLDVTTMGPPRLVAVWLS